MKSQGHFSPSPTVAGTEDKEIQRQPQPLELKEKPVDEETLGLSPDSMMDDEEDEAEYSFTEVADAKDERILLMEVNWQKLENDQKILESKSPAHPTVDLYFSTQSADDLLEKFKAQHKKNQGQTDVHEWLAFRSLKEFRVLMSKLHADKAVATLTEICKMQNSDGFTPVHYLFHNLGLSFLDNTVEEWATIGQELVTMLSADQLFEIFSVTSHSGRIPLQETLRSLTSVLQSFYIIEDDNRRRQQQQIREKFGKIIQKLAEKLDGDQLYNLFGTPRPEIEIVNFFSNSKKLLTVALEIIQKINPDQLVKMFKSLDLTIDLDSIPENYLSSYSIKKLLRTRPNYLSLALRACDSEFVSYLGEILIKKLDSTQVFEIFENCELWDSFLAFGSSPIIQQLIKKSPRIALGTKSRKVELFGFVLRNERLSPKDRSKILKIIRFLCSPNRSIREYENQILTVLHEQVFHVGGEKDARFLDETIEQALKANPQLKDSLNSMKGLLYFSQARQSRPRKSPQIDEKKPINEHKDYGKLCYQFFLKIEKPSPFLDSSDLLMLGEEMVLVGKQSDNQPLFKKGFQYLTAALLKTESEPEGETFVSAREILLNYLRIDASKENFDALSDWLKTLKSTESKSPPSPRTAIIRNKLSMVDTGATYDDLNDWLLNMPQDLERYSRSPQASGWPYQSLIKLGTAIMKLHNRIRGWVVESTRKALRAKREHLLLIYGELKKLEDQITPGGLKNLSNTIRKFYEQNQNYNVMNTFCYRFGVSSSSLMPEQAKTDTLALIDELDKVVNKQIDSLRSSSTISSIQGEDKEIQQQLPEQSPTQALSQSRFTLTTKLNQLSKYVSPDEQDTAETLKVLASRSGLGW